MAQSKRLGDGMWILEHKPPPILENVTCIYSVHRKQVQVKLKWNRMHFVPGKKVPFLGVSFKINYRRKKNHV